MSHAKVEPRPCPELKQRSICQKFQVGLYDDRIEKEYRFSRYLDGLEFAYHLGKIAEEQDHHPNILIKWRRVKVTLTTHAIKGLSTNNFIMAAKAEEIYMRKEA